MIQFRALRQYTHVVDGIRYPQTPDEPFLLIYFSENSTFIEDYNKLNLRRIDVRTVSIPITRIPRSFVTSEIRKTYRSKGLLVYSIKQKVPAGRNVILDLTQYLKSLDSMYKPSNYRQRAGLLLTSMIDSAPTLFSDNYQKIFIYSVDLTKDMNSFVNRKSFPLLRLIRNGEFNFDHMLICTLGSGKTRYRMLIKDGDYNFNRIFYFLRNLKATDVAEEMDDEVNKASNIITKAVDKHVDLTNKEKVKDAVKDYLKKQPETTDKIVTGDIKKDEVKDVVTTSILYKVSGNLPKAQRIATKVPEKQKTRVLKAVDKKFSGEILVAPKKLASTTTDPQTAAYNPEKIVGDKTPEHLFEKRKIDFETNLKKDLTNSFNVLQTEEIPLKVTKFDVEEKKESVGELSPSDLNIVKISLEDKQGRKHDISLEIPKIDPDTGSFRLNGKRYVLINQIVQCPITFPKPGESRFESSYSVFRIHSEKLRKEKYLRIYIGSYKLPLLLVLSYGFGFGETLRLYGLDYIITTTKPQKDEYSIKINDSEYVVFKKVDSDLKKQLVNSFIRLKIDQLKIDDSFGSRQYFEKLIIAITGRLRSTYLITSNFKYVVDPVAKQVLSLMQLPTDLDRIIKYMAEKVVIGYVIKRNDLSNQRIRNSEVLVHLMQKQILSAYTTYKEQVLSGNKEAKLVINPTKTLSDFIKTELVTAMEYANPIEEMSVITRVSPVGKKVGGIPDKNAIIPESRNIHPTYFGNVDPLDTPESDNIGIVQQLAIDSVIHSSRGLFSTKPLSNQEGTGMLSTTTCMVPFIENNEGARVIMISQQSKQALPLKNPQPPVVQSGYETILTNVLSENFLKKSPCDGKIEKITNDDITIKCKDGKINTVSLIPIHLRSGSGRNTLSTFIPVVNIGNNVKKGQLIAEGACISNGAISLGRPLLTAFMPYKGYNFEDGAVINEAVINADKLTSLHGIEEEVLIEENDRLLFLANIGETYTKGEPILRKTIGEIEQIIGYEEEEGTDVFAGQYIRRSPGGRIVDIEVFSNTDESKFPQLKELIQRTNKKYGRTPKDKFKIKQFIIKGILVRFIIEQELRTKLGDKICNRYGNKGIVSLIEKDELMPRLPNGERVDIILNPIGLLSRMNVGQLYEMYCGLIGRELGRLIPSLGTKSKIIELINKVYITLDKSKNQKTTKILIANLERMNPTQFKSMVNQVEKRGFFPIIIPPFLGPKAQDIYNCLRLLKLKPSYNLYLPEYNTYTQHPVPVGYMNISKLEHLGEAKIYGRSTGPVSAKTAQPTSGKSREGGQKLGELDTYSFISYNCKNVLAEFLGPLSDDYITKEEILAEVVQKGNAKFKEAKISPAKDLLNAYFISLMLEREK